MYKFKVFARSKALFFILAVYINGAFALEVNGTAATTNNPPQSQMRDLNADGNLDFVTTHSKQGGVTVALGLGNGKFAQPMNFLSGKKPLTVIIRDFNRDNALDLVAFNFRQRTVSVLLGDGNGNFPKQKIVRMNPESVPLQASQNNLSPSANDPVLVAAPTTANAPAVISTAALEQSINQKINAYRASRKLPALPLNATISNVARTHSQNMAAGRVSFGHQGFDTRVKTISKSFPLKRAGENVAFNQGFSDPAATAVTGWLKSPGHLSNIVGNYNLTGIGVARTSQGKYYFTQIFWRR